MTTTRKAPGPQPDGAFFDPYDALSDDEFDAEMNELFSGRAAKRVPSTRTTIRLPDDVVVRLKAVSAATETPYQTLIRRVLTDAVPRLERAAQRREKQVRVIVGTTFRDLVEQRQPTGWTSQGRSEPL